MSLVPYKVTAIKKTDPTGNNVLAGASVSIVTPLGTFAQLWDDEGGTITRSNPFNVDSNGERQVWINGGEYTVSVAGGQSWDIKLTGGSDILSIDNVSALSAISPAVGQVYILKEYNSGTGKGGSQLVAKTGVITPNNVTTFASATAGVYFERINYPFICASFAGLDASLPDNASAIARLNALPENYKIPEGSFITSVGITLVFDNKKIEGSGTGKTIITLTDETPINLVGVGANNTSISKLTIDGNGSNQSLDGYGYIAYRTIGSVCEDVDITNVFGIAHGFNQSKDCRAKNVNVSYALNMNPGFFNDAGAGSFYADGGHLYDNCTARYCDLDGMIVNTNNVTIRGGDYSHNGLNVGEGGALGAAGIYSDAGVSKIKVIGDTKAHYNTEFGINLVGGTYHDVTESDCQYNALSGISFSNVNSGKISLNTCLNNGTNPTVANPTLWGKAGIQFHTCDNLLISENTANAGSLQAFGVQYMGSSVCGSVTMIGNKLGGVTDHDNIRPGGYYSSNLHPTLLYRANSSVIGPLMRKSTVVNPASIAAGASLVMNDVFSWIGAQFGDFVDVAAPYSLVGIEVFAYVNSINNISLILRNETAAPVDLPSGTWTYLVRSKYAE